MKHDSSDVTRSRIRRGAILIDCDKFAFPVHIVDKSRTGVFLTSAGSREFEKGEKVSLRLRDRTLEGVVNECTRSGTEWIIDVPIAPEYDLDAI